MSPKRRPGRPSGYTEEIGDQICERLLHESLKEICRDEHMPCFTMVFRWIETNLVFRDQYRRARNAQLEVMADEMITLADTCREGAKTKVTKSLDKDDNEVIHTEIITGDMVESAPDCNWRPESGCFQSYVRINTGIVRRWICGPR